jgi:hypothetical protein
MKRVRSLRSDLTYFKQLVGAGFDGIAAARHELDRPVFTPSLQRAAWTPAVLGGTVGALTARLIGKDKRASGIAIGGLVGTMCGVGAALAWTSRDFTRPAARNAFRRVNSARDAHWLELNPIDYA